MAVLTNSQHHPSNSSDLEKHSPKTEEENIAIQIKWDEAQVVDK
jgi:hypothetical protein